MTNIIGVRFKKIGKIYYFNPCGTTARVGQHVIVETSRGEEYGEVALANTDIEDSAVVQPLRKLVRLATKTDDEVMQENERHAKDAFDICRKKIAEHKLDMHLVTVECAFDLNKILFYFTADGRVDFRDLVKDLASVFRTRIELRQIGVRDEAKMLGGLGACGRELCCSSYLDEFQPVSINMAKEQNLSLNPVKISGTCGRLMCCLKYEHEVYAELQKVTPRQQSYVETPAGNGTVISVQMLRGTCRVQLEDSTEAPQVFACADCHTLRAARARTRGPVRREAEPQGDAKTGERPPRPPRPAAPRSDSPRPAREDAPRSDSPRPVREDAPKPDAAVSPSPAPAAPAAAPEGEGDSARRRSRRGGRRRRKRPEGDAPIGQQNDEQPASAPEQLD